jgi:hypothetical protein
MSPRRIPIGLLIGVMTLPAAAACRRKDAATPEQLRAQIQSLERERDELRARLGQLVASDRRIAGLPGNEVRVGVPTTLARTLITRVLDGFVDSVTLKLSNLKVHKTGKVKKVVSIGEFVLDVSIDEVTGNLKTGDAQVTFGGNKIGVALPVKVASGHGDATIDFTWDGKNISGAVCGDMKIQQVVSGTVKPDSYPVSGTLLLTATERQILAGPRFPVVKVNLKIEPSKESWAAVQKILDDKGGVCGFVLDKVNIPGVLDGLISKGFNVRLPTEKIKAVAIPVGIAPTLTVRGEPVTVGVKVGTLVITEHMIWLGADVALAPAPPSPAPPAPPARPR